MIVNMQNNFISNRNRARYIICTLYLLLGSQIVVSAGKDMDCMRKTLAQFGNQALPAKKCAEKMQRLDESNQDKMPFRVETLMNMRALSEEQQRDLWQHFSSRYKYVLTAPRHNWIGR